MLDFQVAYTSGGDLVEESFLIPFDTTPQGSADATTDIVDLFVPLDSPVDSNTSVTASVQITPGR